MIDESFREVHTPFLMHFLQKYIFNLESSNRKHLWNPQSTYAGLQKSLQQEWHFVQRVVKGIGEDFLEIKKAITDLFLPSLFFTDQLQESNPPCNLSKLPMEFAGLALPCPVASSDSNFEASTLVRSHLLVAFRRVEPFSLAERQSVQKTVMADLKICETVLNNSALDSILENLDCNMHRTLL
jgi:hypothetical protein